MIALGIASIGVIAFIDEKDLDRSMSSSLSSSAPHSIDSHTNPISIYPYRDTFRWVPIWATKNTFHYCP